VQKIDEALLIIQLKAGYDRAVRDWFVHYSPAIRKTVAQKVSIEEDVDELVQEIFLACLRELVHFKSNSSLKTWMLSVTHHKVADYYRAKYAKRVIHLVTLLEGLPVGLHDASEMTELVKLALSRLPEFDKELLFAKYVDNKSVRQLAAEYEKSFKSIESLLYRAREAFRKEYSFVLANQ
jgi:RNA polymerase sigma-70 factor, ECF subfamily